MEKQKKRTKTEKTVSAKTLTLTLTHVKKGKTEKTDENRKGSFRKKTHYQKKRKNRKNWQKQKRQFPQKRSLSAEHMLKKNNIVNSDKNQHFNNLCTLIVLVFLWSESYYDLTFKCFIRFIIHSNVILRTNLSKWKCHSSKGAHKIIACFLKFNAFEFEGIRLCRQNIKYQVKW